jgi:hypothetical protein
MPFTPFAQSVASQGQYSLGCVKPWPYGPPPSTCAAPSSVAPPPPVMM